MNERCDGLGNITGVVVNVTPTKVTRSALQNAASIASLILTADVMIAELPGKQQALAGEMDAMGM